VHGTIVQEDGLTMRFSATLENVDTACNAVGKIMSQRQVGKSIFATELLLREALNNAVLHGSKADPRKTVQCIVSFKKDFLVIEVSDEGEGFCWRSAIQERMVTESSSGRGLPIMKAYAAEMLFNDKGNQLKLKVMLPREEAV